MTSYWLVEWIVLPPANGLQAWSKRFWRGGEYGIAVRIRIEGPVQANLQNPRLFRHDAGSLRIARHSGRITEWIDRHAPRPALNFRFSSISARHQRDRELLDGGSAPPPQHSRAQ